MDAFSIHVVLGFLFFFLLCCISNLKIILVLNKKNAPQMRKGLEKNVIISPSSLLPSSSVIEIRIEAGPTKIIQNIFVKYLAHLRLIVCAQLKVLALILYV